MREVSMCPRIVKRTRGSYARAERSRCHAQPLTDARRRRLSRQGWVHRTLTLRIEVRLQQRARIVLLAAKGLQNKGIALKVALDRRQVALWRQRFQEGGIPMRCARMRRGRGVLPASCRIWNLASCRRRCTRCRRMQPTGARARWPSTWAWSPPQCAGLGATTA